MADITQCDGCGKVSPDENRLFIANKWYVLKVTSTATKYESKIDYCEDCFQKRIIAK